MKKFVIILAVFAVLFLGGVILLINSGNPLIGADVKEYALKSGSGTEIGKYAVVQLSNKDFEKLTPEYYCEFAKETVDGSGYNYFTIASKDGRGAVWSGSDVSVLTVGTLDADYMIAEAQTVYTLNGGAYIQTEE